MASLENLPSDQRAVLELVLRRGRSYDEIAGMLSIDRAGVRARALAALDALGPEAPISVERRHLITDYLLGALPTRVADEVRTMLAQSPPERAWARVVASELEPIASSPLPEIPVEAGAPAPLPPRERPRAEPAPAEARPERRTSRRGGAIVLLGGAIVAIAVAAVLVALLGGGGSKQSHSQNLVSRAAGPPSTSATTNTTSAATTTGAQVLAQVNLNPPSGGTAKGVAVVLKVGTRTGVEIRADGLAPNTQHPPNAYAVWLSNTPGDSHILGFVSPGVGRNGQLQTAGGLPSNAKHYGKLLITVETKSNPRIPGKVVLEGMLTGLS